MDITINRHSIRGLAFRILNQITGAGASDDRRVSITVIEGIIIDKYGDLLRQEDLGRLKNGKLPDQSRIESYKATIQRTSFTEAFVVLPNMMTVMGVPYVSYLGLPGGDYGFVPATFIWQMKSLSKRSHKPVFLLEREQALLRLRPDHSFFRDVLIMGIPSLPFSTLDRNDPFFWETDWDIPEGYKSQIETATLKQLLGGLVPTAARVDTVNNGTEK